MTSQTLALTAADQTIRVRRVGGSLKVEGWDRQELVATGALVQLGRDDEVITVSCAGDLDLKAPRASLFHIDFVGGGLTMHDLAGTIEISFVGSDVELRDLSGSVTFRGLVGGSTRLENVSRVVSTSDGVGPFGAVGAGAWRNVEKAVGRADEQRRRLEKKIHSAERKLNRVRVAVNGESARWKWRNASGPAQPVESGQPVSDEERVTILRMLQEKKITAEEADRLLGALEGQA